MQIWTGMKPNKALGIHLLFQWYLCQYLPDLSTPRHVWVSITSGHFLPSWYPNSGLLQTYTWSSSLEIVGVHQGNHFIPSTAMRVCDDSGVIIKKSLVLEENTSHVKDDIFSFIVWRGTNVCIKISLGSHGWIGGGWGCEVSCGGHHRPRGKTTTGSALDGAVFDIAQILAYPIHNMSRSQLYLGFGHFGWLPSFFGQ